jgi:hypothetical protein
VHLQIKPGLRTAWRAPDSLQIGLDPRRGAVLEGLTADDRGLVDRLARGLDDAALPGGGPGAERARRLLGLLRSTDLLVAASRGRAQPPPAGPASRRLAPDAAVWGVVHPGDRDGWEVLAARSHRSVQVAGSGRLASALVDLLTAAGVGEVTPLPAAPEPSPGDAADLVVLVRTAVADSVAGDRLLAADVPHLSVVVREAGIVVGPLVLPGGAPCLRCLDLHRTDRDPGWPRLLAQLPGRPSPGDAGETASSHLGAGLAALQVLAHLDAAAAGPQARPRPAAVGATLEIDLPDGLVARRPWPVHPACGCAWPAAASLAAPEVDRPAAPRVTGGAPGPGQGE